MGAAKVDSMVLWMVASKAALKGSRAVDKKVEQMVV
jgi:hypothetical protein